MFWESDLGDERISVLGIRRSTLLSISGILFCLAALLSAFRSADLGMGAVWLALGVTFFALARSESKKSD
jgi:hypothetical protein